MAESLVYQRKSGLARYSIWRKPAHRSDIFSGTALYSTCMEEAHTGPELTVLRAGMQHIRNEQGKVMLKWTIAVFGPNESGNNNCILDF